MATGVSRAIVCGDTHHKYRLKGGLNYSGTGYYGSMNPILLIVTLSFISGVSTVLIFLELIKGQ